MTGHTERRHRFSRLFYPAVFLFSLILLTSTSEMLPLVWDEGELIDRASKITRWLESPSLDKESIREHWKTTTVVEGHPAGYAIVIVLGRKIAGFFPFLSPKTSWRFGSMLFMSIAMAFTARRLTRDYDRWSAIFAVFVIFGLPRLFAHAHFATCDAPLMAAWLLCWSLFPDFRETTCTRKKIVPTVIWGVTLGLTFSMKFTGWIAFLPFCLFGLFHLRRWFSVLAVAFFVAILTFFILNPPLWHEPVSGFLKFVHLNTHRDEVFNISICFLGKRYDLDHSLPWYNTIFWTLITVPIPFLILAILGMVRIFRNRPIQTTGLLLVFHWLILLLVRSLPGIPPHDGTRLFIASFPFLGILAGLGAAELCRRGAILCRKKNFMSCALYARGYLIWKTRKISSKGLKNGCLPTAQRAVGSQERKRKTTFYVKNVRNTGNRYNEKIAAVVTGWLMIGFVLVSLLNGGRNLVLTSPQWLSYYNGVIGGLPGAVRSGMEATYYWDSLDTEVIAWLNENTSPGRKVKFAASSSKTLRLVREWSGLKPEFSPSAPGEYQWYVIQRRPGAVKPWEVRLFRDAEPVYRRRISSGTGWPWDVRETTVLYVFRYCDINDNLDF